MTEIFFHFEEVNTFPLPEDTIQKALKEIADHESHELGAINFILCSDQYLLHINQTYLQHDYFTDVITFDYSDGSIAGDIFISIDRIIDNANRESVQSDNELSRVMIHGALHLMGYGDKTNEQKIEMRQKENAYLSLFPKFSVPRGTSSP